MSVDVTDGLKLTRLACPCLQNGASLADRSKGDVSMAHLAAVIGLAGLDGGSDNPLERMRFRLPVGKEDVMDYRKVITLEPGKRGGKPCIGGLRVTVYDVLDYLASGMGEDDILRDFPYLTREDIRACLAYAADRERHLLAVSQ